MSVNKDLIAEVSHRTRGAGLLAGHVGIRADVFLLHWRAELIV
jgi:hypothetical protein